jgi:hypothetical protein
MYSPFVTPGFFVLLVFVLLTGGDAAHAQTFAWAKSTGGINGDVSEAVTTDATGNVYTTGGFSGTVDFDPGVGVFNLTSTGGGMFVSKLDASGNLVWAKAMGTNNYAAYGYSIAVDAAGNVYITGRLDGTADFDPGVAVVNLTSAGINDIFVSKLDALGNLLWVKAMGSTSYDEGTSIAVDATGNVYTTGGFSGTVDFNPGSAVLNLTAVSQMDVFISKLDGSGNFLWAKAIGGQYDDGATLALDAAGNVYASGYFSGTVDFDPGAAVFNLTSPSLLDVFVMKLDVAGNFLWARAFVGTGWGEGSGIAVDAAGNVYTTGGFYGTIDFDPGAAIYNLYSPDYNIFVSKLNTSGNFVWARAMGSSTWDDQGFAIAVDAVGSVYTTGYFYDNADFDPGPAVFNLNAPGNEDIFISKLDASGSFVWAQQIAGSSADDRGWSIAVDGSGNIYTTGHFEGTSDFDPSPSTFNLTSAGYRDVFIHKISQCAAAPSQPPVITGSTSPCSASSQTYSVAAVTGATSYTWTLPSGWTGTSTTNTITATAGATGGNITVVAVNACGTSTAQTLAVTVSPGPSATITAAGATSFCQGGSVTLNANTGTGLTYQWQLNGTNITGATTASYTANAAGSYTVVVTSTSCSSTSAATTVTVNPLPTATITQAGNVLTAPSGFASYKWYKNGSLITGATAPTYTATSSGSYYVIVTNANNCSGQSNTIGLTVGINDISASSVQIYPNPGDGMFYLDISVARNTPVVRVFNILGQEVKAEVKAITAGKLCIEISNKQPGTYYVQLVFPEKVMNTSILIR